MWLVISYIDIVTQTQSMMWLKIFIWKSLIFIFWCFWKLNILKLKWMIHKITPWHFKDLVILFWMNQPSQVVYNIYQGSNNQQPLYGIFVYRKQYNILILNFLVAKLFIKNFSRMNFQLKFRVNIRKNS